MRTSEHINEVAAALADAQGALKPAVKDAVNPAYRSKYADLAAVWDAVHAALPAHGLAIVQELTNENGGVAVTTRITHKSGQWIELGPFTVPLAKQDAHGVGSAASYAKRYALSAAVGVVAEEDDDGNAAAQGDSRKPGREAYTGSEPPFKYQGQGRGRRPVETVPAPVMEADGPKEEDREFYLGAIRRSADKAKLGTEERLALQTTFLDNKPGKAAAIDLVHKLYLFLGDEQAIADWRAQAKVGA